MGGGGTIIIHQAEKLRNLMMDPVFYNYLNLEDRDAAEKLAAKPLAEWTSDDTCAAVELINGALVS